MNNTNPSLNTIRYAVVGMILALNGIFLSGLIKPSGKLYVTITSHIFVGLLLIGLYLLVKKLAAFGKPMLLIITMLFELVALIGFATIFTHNTGLYLWIGSAYAILGVLVLVPQLSSDS